MMKLDGHSDAFLWKPLLNETVASSYVSLLKIESRSKLKTKLTIYNYGQLASYF